jgi:hypothetical protein
MKGADHIRLAVLGCLVLLFCPIGNGQVKRNLDPIQTGPRRLSATGKYYALVIGIDKYPAPLNQLVTAVNDARAVAAVLEKNYGFQVKLLVNQDATRVNILNSINQFRDTLSESDSLLIYYAGHGYSDHAADKAYWLPIDAESIYSSNRIIADELTTDVRVQNARHVLIISDSCYSGGLARDVNSTRQSGGNKTFIDRMFKSKSRTLMASGGDEPVSDSGTDGHSVFAYAIIRSLQQEGQSIFTASDLFYSSVRQQVAGKSQQLPQYSVIRNSDHDEGDFVFLKKGATFSDLQQGDSDSADHDQGAVSPPPIESFLSLKAPVGAEIHIDQQFTGHSTGDISRIKVEPGSRTVEVFLAGYQPWKQVVPVDAGRQSDVVANLLPMPKTIDDGSKHGTPMSEKDMGKIRELITRYEGAVNSRDVRQIKAIWPEIPSKRADQYRGLPKGTRITLTLTTANLLEGNDNAIVKCKQHYTLEDKPQTQDDSVTFYIGRFNSGWIINQIPSSD